MREAAGRGANEVLAWVAAFAAFSAGGQFTIEQEFYEAIPGWIAGMAMMAARQTDCLPTSATKSAKGGGEAASVTPAFYWRLRQQCWVRAFAHSDVRTDELSETEFNGGGRLQAHISFNRIGILLAAMRSVIREGNKTMKKQLAIVASMAVLMTISGQALAETTARSDRQAVYAYNAFDRAVATGTDATDAHSYHGGPKYND